MDFQQKETLFSASALPCWYGRRVARSIAQHWPEPFFRVDSLMLAFVRGQTHLYVLKLFLRYFLNSNSYYFIYLLFFFFTMLPNGRPGLWFVIFVAKLPPRATGGTCPRRPSGEMVSKPNTGCTVSMPHFDSA